MKKRKIKLTQVINALRDPYFHPTKQLTLKDEVFLSMLENCQNMGPCYVITDPSLRGIALQWSGQLHVIYFIFFLCNADNPIIYASEGFSKFTGYSKEEIEGRNCRFLQGKDSNPADIARIREAIEKKEEISLCLLNYRKDGTTFHNQVITTIMFSIDPMTRYLISIKCEHRLNRSYFPSSSSSSLPSTVMTEMLLTT